MITPHQATQERRSTLALSPNPRVGLDYVITQHGALESVGTSFMTIVRVRYIPDELILPFDVLHEYLRTVTTVEADTIENLGALITGDLDAELLPRWIQVRLSTERDGHQHIVAFEQRKPGWENRLLIARIDVD